MRKLWPLALWAATAVAALFVAVLAGRSEVGLRRAAIVLSSLNLAPSPPSAFDVESVTKRLTQAVNALAEDRNRLSARLAALEHKMDDMTGSITQQIEAAKAGSVQAIALPAPNDEPPVWAIPADIAAGFAPVGPPMGGVAFPLLPSPLAPVAAQSPPDATAFASPPPAYGADIGGALSINVLHARWVAVRAAHPRLLAGLEPAVTIKENPRSMRIELRLLVGPLPSIEAAAQLCASLAAFRLFCQPTNFDGRHLALR
ncbi:MAG TPA: hypothetical protein VJX48_09175 [Xanthobacteraceae bacterium]|nr:hypothetical protein [Xanthobacteraceae bacterium]